MLLTGQRARWGCLHAPTVLAGFMLSFLSTLPFLLHFLTAGTVLVYSIKATTTTDDPHITAPPTIINGADTVLSSSHPPKTQSPLFVPFNSEDQGGLEQRTNHAWQRSGEKRPHPGGARQLCLHQHPPRQGAMRQTLKHHLRARGHALQRRQPLLWDLGRWQGPSTSICPMVMGQLRPAHCTPVP